MSGFEGRPACHALGVTIGRASDLAHEALASRLAAIRWNDRIARIKRREAEIAAANRPFGRAAGGRP